MQNCESYKKGDLNSHTIVKWKKQARRSLKLNFPNLSKYQINLYLDKVIKERLKNPDCRIHNNVHNVEDHTSLLDLSNWIHKEKPITTEHGVLYKNQEMVDNPAANTLSSMKKDRNAYKSLMHTAAETKGRDSREYKDNNRFQGGEKIDMNSYYGASGLVSSIFYNLYNALSTTGKGQAIISTSCAMFESFMANNVKFLDVNEMYTYIDNVRKDSKKSALNLSEIIDGDIAISECATKLHETFKDMSMIEYSNIVNILSNLPQDIVNRLYYKSNLFEFITNSKVFDAIINMIDILDKTPDYKTTSSKGKLKYFTDKIFFDPSTVPLAIEIQYKYLIELLQDFVLYNHMYMDRIGRLKHEKRASVVTIDTDSNMININKWVVMFTERLATMDIVQNFNTQELRFNIVNILSGACTTLVNVHMMKFGETSNIPMSHRWLINMKNEFLFSRMLLSKGKKNYASIIELQEGKFINPGDLDIKGLPITKSVLNKGVQKIFLDILDTHIMRSETIEVHHVLQKLSALSELIKQSLLKGEFTFTSPKSPKRMDNYKAPFSEAPIKAVAVWNKLYPDQLIQLPSSIYLVKVNMEDIQDVVGLAKTEPRIFQALKDNFYQNSEIKELKKINAIAIPRDLKEIPAWIIPYIKVDIISRDILKKFYPILDAIGIILTPGSDANHSNVIQF